VSGTRVYVESQFDDRMRSRALVACAVLKAYVYDEGVINRDPGMKNVISPGITPQTGPRNTTQ
jgi:hypothetical protein